MSDENNNDTGSNNSDNSTGSSGTGATPGVNNTDAPQTNQPGDSNEVAPSTGVEPVAPGDITNANVGVQPNPNDATQVTVTVSGSVKGQLVGKPGQKLKEILAAHGRKPAEHDFREMGTSRPVSIDRVINDSISLTATQKAEGG